VTDVGKSRTGHSGKEAAKGGNPISRWFGAIGLFVRQVLDELRKVVRPTRAELIQYTVVVIVFVVFMMALVSALDFIANRLIGFVFGT
jgi:preprotein translocase subunit SecE